MIRASTLAREPNSATDGRSPPSIAEVRAALDRMLASSTLRAAPRLAAFLRCVVERTIEGRSAEIKSYTIAVEALDRAPSFDPQTDPIVRVEASRLRHALARYYAGEGHDDPIAVDFVRGSYVPSFQQRNIAPRASVDRKVSVQALLHRLAELHRQLEAVSAEIERAWEAQQRSGLTPRRHD
jgi:hypothetical protein